MTRGKQRREVGSNGNVETTKVKLSLNREKPQQTAGWISLLEGLHKSQNKGDSPKSRNHRIWATIPGNQVTAINVTFDSQTVITSK